MKYFHPPVNARLAKYKITCDNAFNSYREYFERHMPHLTKEQIDALVAAINLKSSGPYIQLKVPRKMSYDSSTGMVDAPFF